MASLPMHLQVLRAVRRRLEKRREELREKVGNGLEDRDYQRHVGRIAEIKVALDAVEELMAGGINLVEDEEQTEREQRRAERAAHRGTRGH